MTIMEGAAVKAVSPGADTGGRHLEVEMPRISAATVADHRANQHAALLDAARAVLAEQGVHALTPAAVGARVGLARSSVYRYFASTADILAQLVEDAFPRWLVRLRDSLRDAGDGVTLDDRIRAYGTAALDFVSSPDHALIPASQAVGLPGECQKRVDEIHESMIEPLREALDEAGYDHAGLRAHLAWGILGAGSRRLADEEGDSGEIVRITLDTLCRALR
ncbi:TetR/AcrR family transcriptional regulator [Microtetraspora sp. AC03309]|uniref:TetR/AcrR family transcriptional regulator n=1 Tax=Microtetraspora sp. AC03309 TaxID=2779376 RepID=UPI001E4D0FE1|nr:TetR/AcrR family transcriptional regulator [Microtetraspora sp. AC03309]MCC5579392.1 TetR/AcrR family transcriptional regulator [Microtetraspora sp. AC03309]